MKSVIAVAVALCALPAFGKVPASRADFFYVDYSGSDPIDAAQPLQPGQFRNPVIPGFYPDPSVVRVGNFFYLVNSSFGFFPGLPIFRSRDLVNWTQIGNAIDRPGMVDFSGIGINRGLFAPTIRHNAGRFYIVNTCIDCGLNFIISARDPAGPWSAPVYLPEIDGIDPDLFFDSDGSVWIANNGPPEGSPRYDGHRAIGLQQFDLKQLKLVGPRRVIVDGGVHPERNPIWTEGPHIVRRDGWYYLFAAEGGTAGDHSETVYRARRVTGPYAPGPVNPILTQRDLPPDRPDPVMATGHVDPVQDRSGKWWAVFLGTRPHKANLSNLGRETFLLPMKWPRGGWPVILPPGTPVPLTLAGPVALSARDHWRDDFVAPKLAPRWLMLRTPREPWHSLLAVPGNLSLTPRPETLSGSDNPSFLALRQQHRNALIETEISFAPSRPGDRAGLAVFADERHHYFFGIVGGENPAIVVAARSSENDPEAGRVISTIAIAQQRSVRLRVSIAGGFVSFAYALPGGPWQTVVDRSDAVELASEATNQFTGTVIGPYASGRR